MDSRVRDVIVWVLLCLTALGLGGMFLTGFTHDSDNNVRIVQIKEG